MLPAITSGTCDVDMVDVVPYTRKRIELVAGPWAAAGRKKLGRKEDGLKEEIGQKELLPLFFPLPEFGNLARDKKRRDRLKI